jgi:hypothetical protein
MELSIYQVAINSISFLELACATKDAGVAWVTLQFTAIPVARPKESAISNREVQRFLWASNPIERELLKNRLVFLGVEGSSDLT